MRKWLYKIWWKSKLRFYVLNLIWNYKFWLFSSKVYKNKSYVKSSDTDFTVDVDWKMIPKKFMVPGKRRFYGYFYKNQIYLDNPGVQEFVDKKTLQFWINNKFIKI